MTDRSVFCSGVTRAAEGTGRQHTRLLERGAVQGRGVRGRPGVAWRVWLLRRRGWAVSRCFCSTSARLSSPDFSCRGAFGPT